MSSKPSMTGRKRLLHVDHDQPGLAPGAAAPGAASRHVAMRSALPRSSAAPGRRGPRRGTPSCATCSGSRPRPRARRAAEVDQRQVGRPRRRRASAPAGRGPRPGRCAHAPHQHLERHAAGAHQVGVAGGEGRLEAGHPEGRLLEGRPPSRAASCGAWSVATQSRVPSSERRDQRLAGPTRSRSGGFILCRAGSSVGDGLVGEHQVVGRDLAGDAHAARLGPADLLDRLGGGDVADVDATRPRTRRAPRRGPRPRSRRPTGCRPAPGGWRPRPRA